MTEPSAKVIADSISPAGHRLTTMEVVMHRFVLAEFNTHRVFSRNSASSRAIPLGKQVRKVCEDPAIPLVFPYEMPGMQGGDDLPLDDERAARELWVSAAQEAATVAETLGALGVHKSVANRILEPFLWHTVVVTSTEWSGFWKQRCSPLAQPEMRAAAEAMKAAYDASEPRRLGHADWHLPYYRYEEDELSLEDCKRVAVARCARVSYLTQDGRRDPAEDLKLYDRLVSADPPHASPLEHVATPCYGWGHTHLGNFTGWDQLRHEELP